MAIRDHLNLILILIALTLLVYYDSFNNSFIWDDYSFIVENQAVRRLDIENIMSDFWDWRATASNADLAHDVWRPLVTLSFAIDYNLWKLKPRFYHIENTVFHIINTVLVYIAAVLIFGDILIAFVTSLIFSIHPVQTEAVTWISGRSNVLFLAFFLLSFVFHTRGRKAPSLIFFFLSLLSKEMAVVLPLILILYDLYFGSRKGLKYYIRYYIPLFIISASYLVARYSVIGTVAQRESWWGESIAYNILTMVKAVAGYIRILFVPLNLRAEYVVNISKSVFEAGTIIAIMILCAVVGASFVFRRRKEVSFYVLWFFITLIPVYNIIPFKAIMAERFLYLPSIAYASLVAMVFSKSKGVFKLVLIAVMALYGLGTISRNIEWRDELIFCHKEITRSPANPRFHYNLGLAYLKEADKTSDSGQLSKSYLALAMEEFKMATALKKDFEWAYVNLANVYDRLGLYDLAIENYKKAITVKAEHVAYNNLSIAYYHKGLYDEAILASKRSISLKPDHADAYINLGNAYFIKGDHKRAEMAWSNALRWEREGY